MTERGILDEKIISSLLTFTVVLSIPFNCMAASQENKSENLSDVIVIREDVPREEAIKDESFDAVKSLRNNYIAEPRSVTWKVWGSRDEGRLGATPIGYSAHMDGDTVLETYHYTRTYLGELLKFGDSSRVWGNYTVKAVGQYCDYDVWGAHTHIVKYGTED